MYLLMKWCNIEYVAVKKHKKGPVFECITTALNSFNISIRPP